MANALSWRVEVDPQDLKRTVRALKREADGKELAKDLIAKLRLVATPALQAARSAILSMPSQHDGTLRGAVARQTKISVRTTGKHPGLSIYVLKTGMPRGFSTAPKHLNSAKGWRHPVFGHRDRWVSQLGKPGWFDITLIPFRRPAVAAADAALKEAAKRVSERSKT